MWTPDKDGQNLEKKSRNKGGRPKDYDDSEPMDPQAYGMAHDLVNGLSTNMKQLVLCGGEHSMTARQKQKMASETMVSLMMQPEYRVRFADWALKNPGDAAKLMASQIPKEVHIEQTTNQCIVLLPAGMSPEAWQEENDKIEDAEIVPWLTDRLP